MGPLASLLIFFFLINASLSLGYILGTLQVYELLRAIIYLDFLLFPLVGLGFCYYFFQKKIFFAIPNYFLLSGAILLLTIFTYSLVIEPYSLRVRHWDISTKKLTKPIRIVHVSDIQAYDMGNYERSVFQKIKELKPDLIIHTGHLVQHPNVRKQNKAMAELADLLAGLNPPYGIYSVVGSNDFYTTNVFLFDSLAHTQTLVDEYIQLPQSKISILGLSPQNARYGTPRLVKEWLSQSKEASIKILMGHSPEFMASLDPQTVDLCFAGSTQGGQIRLPGIGPIIRKNSIPTAWHRGSFQVAGASCYVSAGVGTIRSKNLLPIRFNCPPEINVIDLH